jgi:hypothetical protein
VVSCEITWYESRAAAREAERDSILTENPRHNIVGTKRYGELISAGQLAGIARRRELAQLDAPGGGSEDSSASRPSGGDNTTE